MRVIHIGIAGLAVAAVFFAMSQIIGGLIGALAFVTALMVVPLTVGLAIAAVVDSWQGRSRRHGRQRRWWQLRSRARRCSSCGRPLEQIETLLICQHCDRVKV